MIFVAGGGCGDFKYFNLPTGGTGGRGGFNGGEGGDGGSGGNIDIFGAIHPTPMVLPPLAPMVFGILGYDSDNPNFSSGSTIGSLLFFNDGTLTTSSSRGSGGSPGGAAGGFPGLFGAAGLDGTTTINSQIFYP